LRLLELILRETIPDAARTALDELEGAGEGWAEMCEGAGCKGLAEPARGWETELVEGELAREAG
jgi:hypothetical protein